VAKGILFDAADGYHSGQDALREVLLSEMSPERRQALHRRLGDVLIKAGANRPEDLIEAGWHILRGGDEMRGADLLANAAPKLAGRGIATSAALPALEAALEIYERTGRSPRDCLKIRTTMVGSFDRRIAAKYGDSTAHMLFHYAGAPLAARLRPWLGARGSLVVGVLVATARRWLTPQHKRGLRPVTAIAAFYRAGYALMTVRTAMLDIAGMERLAAQAETLSGAGLMGQVTALFIRAATPTVRARPEQARALLHRAVELATGTPEFREQVGPAPSRGVLASIYIGLGMLEAQYALKGQRALDVVDELAKLSTDASILEAGSEEIARQGGITTPEITMAAHQIRMVYHSMRGEREKADAHREKLHLHTIQTGLQFQFDIWRTLVELYAGLRTSDLAAIRRCGELLVQLVPTYPVLAPYLDHARACLSFSLGKPQEALTTLAKWVPVIKPGDTAAWDALYWSYADILFAVGDPIRARELLKQALASDAAEETIPSVMTLTLESQLARAEAECGDIVSATERIDNLMDRVKDADQPVAVGLLHEAGARVAAKARNRERREAHVDLMKRWYALTRNPSMLMRGQRVLESFIEVDIGDERAPSVPPDQETVTRVTTQRQMASVDALFDDCKSIEERAARALHIIVEQTGGTSGHLYLWKDKLRMVASLEGGETNDEVERILQERFQNAHIDDEPEASTDARALAEISTVGVTADGSPEEERLATLMLSTGGKRAKLIGAVALRVGSEPLRPMRRAVVEAIASNIVPESSAS
jgi:tetratricopeptide (TPR) repeat protein